MSNCVNGGRTREYIVKCKEFVSWISGETMQSEYVDMNQEIVRCRDCKRCYACGSFMFCEFRRPDEPVNADGYCAWGVKRKEGGDD